MAENFTLDIPRIRRTKKPLYAITLAALLALGIFTVLPVVSAHSPPQSIDCYAFLQVVPNPVGVSQHVYVEMWIDHPPPTANGPYGDRWQNFTVKVTSPDGSVQTLGPFTSDAVGGADVEFTPTAVGTYSFVFSFPGQTIVGANMGPSTQGEAYIGDYYKPATSTTETLTVQQQPVAMVLPENPLPTGYWQNPVEAFNHNWNVIDGNWLGMATQFFAASGVYNMAGNFNPYTTAPTTSHIVWTMPETFGGQIGGEFGNSEQSQYYAGFQYQLKFSPIVIGGILYFTQYPGSSANPEGWKAVNLRTGQVIWTKNTTAVLMCGQTYNYKSMNQYGGNAYLWSQTGTTYSMYDAMTGNWILNIVNGTGFGAKVEAQDGSILGYYINYTDNTLVMWNSSKCILAGTPGYYPNATPIVTPQWSPPQGASIDFSRGIEWSMPIANNYLGAPLPTPLSMTITYATFDLDANVVVLTAAAGMGIFEWQSGYQIQAGYSLTTGQQLWITNRTETPDTTVIIGPAGNGVFTQFDKETMTWTAYNDTTGQYMWGPTAPYTNPWGYYDQDSAVIAYGNLYTWTLGGYIYCYNLQTGALKWSWNTGSAGENTPYGVYPLWIIMNYENAVGGGVIYVEGGHDYGPPMYSGCQLYAINATSGQKLWSILNFDSGATLALVDGYLLALNSYDNQIYCYGKGLTATTVTYSPVVGSSNSVVLQGTVTDQSPGQTCLGIPAAGTPAVSDSSMSAWMEYMYEQSPCPTNATGVPVTLSVVDPNNNTYVIGQTTSDASGNYALEWTPPVPGMYTVTATFGGSGAYYSSTAETHLYFATTSPAAVVTPSPAPTTTGQPTSSSSPTSNPTTTTPPTASSSPSPAPAPSQGPSTEIYIIAAAAAVIIILAAAAAVIIKKRTK